MMNIKRIVIVISIISIVIACICLIQAYQYSKKIEFCGACHVVQYSTYMGSSHDDAGTRCHDCHSVVLIGSIEIRESRENVTIPLLGREEMITASIGLSRSSAAMTLSYYLDECETPVTNVSMESCFRCHPAPEGVPHVGVRSCAFCHNPHVTRELADFMEYECSQCHRVSMVGIHVSVTCRGCHVRHAHIPNCVLCHRPHAETLADNADCMMCHANPHSSPGTIFHPNIPKEACSCHRQEYEALTSRNSAHNTFTGTHRDFMQTYTYNFTENCIVCHPRHEQTKKCAARGCHFNHPHRTIGCRSCHVERHPGCDCHINAHAPRIIEE